MKTIYKKLLFSVLLLPLSVLAQSTLTGTVTDKASGQPMPGVSVVVQGTTNGTSTDFDGKFSLSGVKNGEVLLFSFIGYKDVTQNYTGQKSVNVAMEEEVNQLQEVLVQIGYGAVRKKDVTGAVTQLSAKEFNKGANVTAENLLAGRVAGVTVNLGGGAPGSGAQIRIRGGSSLSALNDPLIVIDGLPINNAGNTGSTSILAALNPNDIESFNILKDASATAIYGSRAANGVIIINTKRGAKDLSVEYNFQYGSGNAYRLVDVMDARQFSDFVAGVDAANALAGNPSDNFGRLGVPSGIADNPATPEREDRILSNTNWQEEIYRRTDFADNNLSIRGNLFNTIPTKLTLNNTYQEGLRLTNTFQRTATSLAMNPRFFDNHLKINLSANFTVEKNRFANGVEGSAVRFDPTKPVYYAPSSFNGYFEYEAGGIPAPQSPRNPVAELNQTNDRGRNDRLFGNFEIDYKFHFLPSVRAVVNLGYDQSYGTRTRFRSALGVATSPTAPNSTQPIGLNSYISQKRTNKLLDAYLAFNKTFGAVNVDATAGYSYQIFTFTQFDTQNKNDDTPATVPVTRAAPDNVIIGYFGRSNFTFFDKYLLTVSFRRDGASRFSEENRWSFFPAAAFAWRMNDEFFKNSKTVSDLKLRLGYGQSGQQELPVQDDYYLARYNVGDLNSQYNINGTFFNAGVPAAYNSNLKWETTTTYNVGIDYGFFNNRISGSVDAFYKLTDNLFFIDTPFADGSNFSNQGPANIGSFSTKGIEFSINAAIVQRENFNWNINFNATRIERRIEELVGNADVPTGSIPGGFGTTSSVHREGFTPFSFLMYKQLYDPSGRAIEGAFADLNGDGIINSNDRYIYKNPDPDATFGFSSNLNYKNFDFSFFLRASVGNRVYNQVAAGRSFANTAISGDAQLANLPTSYYDNLFTIPTTETVLSDLYIENASFLRMDNITMGYTFPKWLDGKASLRLFTGCQNAFVITKYSGLDPEINNNGLDNTIYPRQRQFLFGVNVKF